MNCRRPQRDLRRAFTLMEVMIAIVASAMVLVAINGIFFGAIRLRNKAAEAAEAAIPLDRTVAYLRRDLANLVLPGGTLFGSLQTTATTTTSTNSNNSASQSPVLGLRRAEVVSPDFYTTAGTLDDYSPWGEVVRVSYFLLESTTNQASRGRDLYRSASRNLLPVLSDDLVSERLMSDVEMMEFFYHDGTGWQTYWDSSSQTNSLPLAIKVSITQVAPAGSKTLPDPIEIVVPVMAERGTNTTSSTTSTSTQAASGSTGGGQQ